MSSLPRRLAGESSPPPPPYSEQIDPPLNSDFVVILAALLCALICVLGLVTVARCTWIRRLAGGGASTTTPTPAAPSPNKGLKKKVLKSLPKQTYGADEVQAAKLSDCAICLADFAAGEEIRILPQCGHGFHVACIDTWLGSHSSCPSCRQILVVARCRKCGELPAAIPCERAGARPEMSGNHVNGFLP